MLVEYVYLVLRSRLPRHTNVVGPEVFRWLAGLEWPTAGAVGRSEVRIVQHGVVEEVGYPFAAAPAAMRRREPHRVPLDWSTDNPIQVVDRSRPGRRLRAGSLQRRAQVVG